MRHVNCEETPPSTGKRLRWYRRDPSPVRSLSSFRGVNGAPPLLRVAVLCAASACAIGHTEQAPSGQACDALQPDPSNGVLGRFPRPAPELVALDHAGNAVRLSSYRDGVVLVHFWASWCKPCLEELPSLEKLHRAVNDSRLTTLAVASNNDWARVDALLSSSTPLTVLLDRDSQDLAKAGAVAQGWGTQLLPETYLVDARGVVRYYFANKRDWGSESAARCVTSLLSEH